MLSASAYGFPDFFNNEIMNACGFSNAFGSQDEMSEVATGADV